MIEELPKSPEEIFNNTYENRIDHAELVPSDKPVLLLTKVESLEDTDRMDSIYGRMTVRVTSNRPQTDGASLTLEVAESDTEPPYPLIVQIKTDKGVDNSSIIYPDGSITPNVNLYFAEIQ